MKSAFLPLGAVLALAGCGGADDRAPAGLLASSADSLVSVDVVAAATAAVPGQPLTLGWRLTPAAGWHLYGPFLNDSGMPPRIDLQLPAGWTAGPLRWPVAERLEAPGGLLDHVYHGETLLLQTVTAPADAAPGDTVVMTAGLEWLACRDVCVLGGARLEFRVPVDAHALPTTFSTPIASALRALPRPADAGPDDIRAETGDGSLLVAVSGAGGLEFHPFADGAEPRDLRAAGLVGGERLVLSLKTNAAPVRGVLIVRPADGAARSYLLELPANPAGEGGP